MLDQGEVDVVQIVPDMADWQPGSGQRPTVEVYSRTIDPTAEAWIRSLAFAELNFINQSLLSQEASAAQATAKEVTRLPGRRQEPVPTASAEPQSAEHRPAREAVAKDLQTVLSVFLALLPPLSDAQANLSPELYQIHRDAQVLLDDLTELAKALSDGDVPSQVERLASTVDEIDALRSTAAIFVDAPPETIISPVRRPTATSAARPMPWSSSTRRPCWRC